MSRAREIDKELHEFATAKRLILIGNDLVRALVAHPQGTPGTDLIAVIVSAGRACVWSKTPYARNLWDSIHFLRERVSAFPVSREAGPAFEQEPGIAPCAHKRLYFLRNGGRQLGIVRNTIVPSDNDATAVRLTSESRLES